MKLLEDPGQKLKKAIGILFVLGIAIIAIAAFVCIAALASAYYISAGAVILVIAVAAIAFLGLWAGMLAMSAYADIAEQLKKQTEILERLESKGGSKY